MPAEARETKVYYTLEDSLLDSSENIHYSIPGLMRLSHSPIIVREAQFDNLNRIKKQKLKTKYYQGTLSGKYHHTRSFVELMRSIVPFWTVTTPGGNYKYDLSTVDVDYLEQQSFKLYTEYSSDAHNSGFVFDGVVFNEVEIQQRVRSQPEMTLNFLALQRVNNFDFIVMEENYFEAIADETGDPLITEVYRKTGADAIGGNQDFVSNPGLPQAANMWINDSGGGRLLDVVSFDLHFRRAMVPAGYNSIGEPTKYEYNGEFNIGGNVQVYAEDYILKTLVHDDREFEVVVEFGVETSTPATFKTTLKKCFFTRIAGDDFGEGDLFHRLGFQCRAEPSDAVPMEIAVDGMPNPDSE